MKRALKIAGWTLLSLVAVVILAVTIAVYVVFTPTRLTPIVRDVLPEFVTCEASIDEADLTFFSTCPKFGIRLTNVCLKNAVLGAPSDTLASINALTATIDVGEFLSNRAVVVDELHLNGGFANIYTDSLGRTNYDIFPPSETEEDTTSSPLPFDLLNVKTVAIDGLRVKYTDCQARMQAAIDNVQAGVSGGFAGKNTNADAKITLNNIAFALNDSTPMSVVVPTLALQAKADLQNAEAQGRLALQLNNLDFVLGADSLVKQTSLQAELPFVANLDAMRVQLSEARLQIAEHALALNGWAQMPDTNIVMNVDFATETWIVEQVLTLMPDAYADLLAGIDVKGEAALSGNASGVYNSCSLPKIVANIDLQNGKVAIDGIPYRLHDVAARASANIDLNDGGVSDATITRLSAKTGSNAVQASGRVDDLLGAMRCNLHLKADVALPELSPILPDDLPVGLQGRTKADLQTRFKLDDVLNMNLERIVANGTLRFTDFDVVYNDSIFVKSPEMTLAVALPSKGKNRAFKELLQADITSPDLRVEMLGTLDVALTNAKLHVATSNVLDTTKMPSATCDFSMAHLVANMDTIAADIVAPHGTLTLSPSRRNPKNPRLQCSYSSDMLTAKMGSALGIDTKFVSMSASTTYDETQENAYLKWNPTLKIDFNDGKIRMAGIEPLIQIPAIKFAFTPRNLTIEDSRIIIDRSDFALKGEAKNIRKFMRGKGLLEGEFSFISEQTDINQLMDLVNGFGSDTATEATEEVAENKAVEEQPKGEDNPFMVPRRVDLTLNTQIKNAVFADNHLQNIGGKLTVKDGVLVLEQMGFTCDAAEMQLTAMYRSERKNHLFAGLDFHLLNIDIKQLIHMVPEVDTVFPMLKSFEGRAEFHLAAETYLKSNYDLKISTLRGAAAIEGKDLVLLDSETFAKIAKPLMFNRKTRNLVDSVSVEATVFRDEVDLYPFVMSMDKYSAVVGGRYDLANNYNAHIETLSPIRLALQIKGNASNLDNMQFKLVKTKYGNMYKPEKRNATQERTLALKKLISDALKSNVKNNDEENDN